MTIKNLEKYLMKLHGCKKLNAASKIIQTHFYPNVIILFLNCPQLENAYKVEPRLHVIGLEFTTIGNCNFNNKHTNTIILLLSHLHLKENACKKSTYQTFKSIPILRRYFQYH